MNILIGDIGNTNTKICLVEYKKFKIKKLTYFNSKKIYSKNFIKKLLKKNFLNKNSNKTALFSSVVPKYK